MKLYIVSTHIGHPKDITLRAIEILNKVDLIVGEEKKPLSKLFKQLEIEKPFELLNEHTTDQEVRNFHQKYQKKSVALVSDAGTPVFCDPGTRLIKEVNKNNGTIVPIPGPSSLMCLLSTLESPLKEFYFAGFPPVKTEDRKKFFKLLSQKKERVILMDTPYRLTKVLNELSSVCPNRKAHIGCDLTSNKEFILTDSIKNLSKKLESKKANFILSLEPQ